MGVQINGKIRDQLQIAADASEEEIIKAATELEKVQKYISGKTIVKSRVIPGRLVSLAVK
jgi:leucyl-tRNA synthetase